MIVHVEKSQRITENLLELTIEYSKFAGYKLNIEKSIVFQQLATGIWS